MYSTSSVAPGASLQLGDPQHRATGAEQTGAGHGPLARNGTLDAWRALSCSQDVRHLQALRIAIVYGALSTEDAVYMDAIPPEEWSAASIEQVLVDLGIESVRLDPCRPDFIDQVRECDIVFLNVHGPFGEDGRIQGLLEFLGVPYTCSSVLASSIGMDKLVSKSVFAHLDIPTPSSVAVDATTGEHGLPIHFPAMLKAVDGGSSIGIAMVASSEAVRTSTASMTARGFSRLFLEQHVTGRIVTSSAIHVPRRGLIVLPPLEAVPRAAYYDEESKLAGSECDYRLLDATETRTVDALRLYTEKVYHFLGCRGAIRVDFIVDDLQTPWALEINTIPGLQEGSNLPVAARMAGMNYSDIIVLLLVDALHRHRPPTWMNARDARG